MKLENSHAVPAGKSAIQKMRDEADKVYAQWMDHEGDGADIFQGRVEGICSAMAILVAPGKEDLMWNSVEARYEDKKRQSDKSS